MLNFILETVLRQRAAVLVGVLVLITVGLWSASKLPMDALPDITNVQVQVNTEVPALAPEEVEQQVTFPIEKHLMGLPGLIEFRSLSKSGLSQVTLVFADGTEIYRARQMVSERLADVGEEIPRGLAPRLSPVATGLGEIFYYTLDYTPEAKRPASRRDQLMELRLLHDLTIKPLLLQTPGIASLNTTGGYEKQIVIQPDPVKLMNAGVTLPELAAKIAENTRNAGGGSVEIKGEQFTVRANSRVTTAAEIAQLPLKFGAGVKPLVVSDLAEVGIGAGSRTGAGTVDGDEALVCAVIMLAGENTRLVSRAVADKFTEIQAKLPPGLMLRTLYDRSHLVNRTLHTVRNNLAEGALLVIVVLFLLLGNLRGAVIVAFAIPLSMLCAVVGMTYFEIPGNLMSLGAIDFGLIIDGAVVMVENIVRHLGERQHALGRKLNRSERLDEVLRSAKEVASPMFFGVIIITLVYVPILALQGIEGKMFQPMAIVVMLALGGALVLSLTLMPVLCALLLGGDMRERDNLLVRWCKRLYAPMLGFGLRHKWFVVVLTFGLFGSAIVLFNQLGAELLPELDEGDFTVFMVRPVSTGLSVSIDTQCQTERVLRETFPEITHSFSRIGTDEVGTDPMGVNVSDAYLMLRPHEEWRKEDGQTISRDRLADLMSEELTKRIPGQSYLFSQPIQMRFNEVLEGTRADVAVKIYGEDFAKLEETAEEISELLEDIPGASDVEFEAVGQAPSLEITPNAEALHRYNLHAEDVNLAVEIAIAGSEVGQINEGNLRHPIVVRLANKDRASLQAIESLPVGSTGGSLLTLGKVATLKTVPQTSIIARENTRRRVGLLVNVRDRDLASFVAEATAAIQEKIELPPGFEIEFGGQFQNYLAARQRLTILVPLALALIFALIYLSFGSFRQAALIFLCVPLAVTGGVAALWWREMPFTISAGIGFIALSGIAMLNGITLISFINQLRLDGKTLRAAITEGTLTRLRPKLMTALVAALGLLPMALATGAGAEVQRPLATVIISGILTSTFLTLLVVPVLYEWIEKSDRAESSHS
jgi:heavy metal efflux system protein